MADGDASPLIVPKDALEDRDKLVRVFFAIMAAHEHSFKVKDVPPNYLAKQYKELLDELQGVLPPPMVAELHRLFNFNEEDVNLSMLQSEAAALLGWLNGALITTGVAQINAPPQLPQRLMSPESQTIGQYL